MLRKMFAVVVGSGAVVAGPALAAEPAAIHVETQTLEAGGLVTLSEVSSPGDGFVVIRTRKGEKPGDVIGRAPVTAGDNLNVSVKLEREIPKGSKLLAVLHEDTGEKGAFEYAPDKSGADMPVQKSGRALMVPFTVK
jgi:hypothetical protein